MYFTSNQIACQNGGLIEYRGVGRTLPVRRVDRRVFDFNKQFVITNFWDRLLFHSNGFGLEGSRLLFQWTTTANGEHSHLLDHDGFHRSWQLNSGSHGRSG